MVPGPFNAIRVRAPAPDRISTVPGVNRRAFLGLAASALKDAPRKPRVACVMNVWFPDSHADVFVSRLLDGYRLDHEWHAPAARRRLVLRRPVPRERYGARGGRGARNPRSIQTVAEAVRCGGIASPWTPSRSSASTATTRARRCGNFMYPRRALFRRDHSRDADAERRPLPLYQDKYFAYDWADAKAIYDGVRRRRVPVLCGSTVPLAWRRPALDLAPGTPFTEILTTSYSDLEEHAYHAIELLQSMAERRKGGETGIARVRHCRRRGTVEARGARRVVARVAGCRADPPHQCRPARRPADAPEAFLVRYSDGLKAAILHANAMTRDYAFAARIAGPRQSPSRRVSISSFICITTGA